MKLLKVILVLIFCLFSANAWALTVDDFSYMTEDYPPFNMSGADGVATGAVRRGTLVGHFRKNGFVENGEGHPSAPLGARIPEVQNTPNTCLFLMTLTDERKPMFKWVGPVVVNTFDAIALKSKGLKIASAEELVGLKAGVIRDDVGDALAQKAGIKQIERVPSNDQNIKKLNEGRIDIWVFGESSAKIQLKEMGMNPDDYESVWRLSESGLYFAFHKDVDDALIASMQKVLDEMKADGTYEAIMKKYNVQ